MPRRFVTYLFVLGLFFGAIANGHFGSLANPQAKAPSPTALKWHSTRSSPSDLEVGGDLAGAPDGSTQFLTREDLLTLPQVSYLVTDDPNFAGPTQVGGVLLGELVQHLSASPQSDLVVAICDDLYRATYPRAYVTEHHPLLVLTINGKGPEGWPKAVEDNSYDMGPYLISHPKFIPSFKILAHLDEAQIPWGVIRIEFRNESRVFGAIAPRGPNAAAPEVQMGYRIAQQNCFRCHNMETEGGQKAGHPWIVLAAWASSTPDYFAAYVHNPKSKNANAQMPGFPSYDQATLKALIAYFRTFLAWEKP